MSACRRSKASGAIGALLSHQISFSTDGVRTTNLSFGRAAGELARRDQERATLAQPPFATAQRGFDQRGLKKVVVNGAEARDPELFKGLIGVNASIRHAECSLVPKWANTVKNVKTAGTGIPTCNGRRITCRFPV
jgi:hypothetical protein